MRIDVRANYFLSNNLLVLLLFLYYSYYKCINHNLIHRLNVLKNIVKIKHARIYNIYSVD